MTRRKIIIPVVALGILAVLIVWWIVQSLDNNDQLTLYGNIELRDAQLAFNEQERVTEVLVEEGAAVEKGQALARLNSTRLEAQLAEGEAMLTAQEETVRKMVAGTRPQEIEQAKAEFEAAQARLKNAELRVRRLKQTTRSGANTEQDLDNAVADCDVARAELNVRQKALNLAREGFRKEDIAEAKAVLKARQANVDYLRERMNDLVLRAPGSGVIQSRTIEPGDMAMPARTAFVFARVNPKWVRAWLPEPKLGHIKNGMKAQVYSDSFRDRSFEGTVGFISPQAEFTPKNVQTEDLRTQLVYEIRINVTDPDNELRLGMPVTVVIDTASDKTNSN